MLAANPVVHDSVEDGMAGMRMELRVCLEVARVRRGCGNKEVSRPPACLLVRGRTRGWRKLAPPLMPRARASIREKHPFSSHHMV
jgi:hypothetical protein